MNFNEQDSAGSACLEVNGRNDGKEGNKERDVLDSLRKASLADQTKISIGKTKNCLDPVVDLIFPFTSEREEEKFRRKNYGLQFILHCKQTLCNSADQ